MSEDDNGTPAWLDSSLPAPAASPQSAAPAQAAQPVSNTATASANTTTNVTSSAVVMDPATLEAVEAEQLRGVILFSRILNLGVSIAVITHSVLIFVSFTANPKYWVLGLYSTCGGCLICCLETQLKYFRTAIAMNFGFLFNPIFRFIYYFLMATVCLSFGDLFGKILAGALVGTACYNTFIMIKYPAYRQMRDKLAKEEDIRIEKKMKENVRKQATQQMFRKK